MKNMKITTDIAEAAAIIASGRVVGVPTGTSYALAADALQGHALQRLRNLKKRPAEKVFTVCVARALWATHLKLTPAERAVLTAAETQALPLTLLVQPQESLAHLAQERRVGVRAADHPLLRALANAVGIPITATSANVSGISPCHTTACVLDTFPSLLDPTQPDIARAGPTTYDLSLGCVLDGGTLPPNPSSTVAYLDAHNQAVIVREGTLQTADVEALMVQRDI